VLRSKSYEKLHELKSEASRIGLLYTVEAP
jgi:hypothetical protein